MRRFIYLDSDNKIIGIRYGSEIVEGEFESETGEIGQIKQSDGTFITPEPEITPPTPTLDDKVEQLKQDNLILMDALASTYEEILNLKAQLGGTA